MSCLNQIEVDLTAIRHNFSVLNRLLKDTAARIMAVVKSDAYGHGLIEVSKVLESAGVWGFGISEVDEAIYLRQGGITAPIFLMSGVPKGAEKEVMAFNLIPGITDISSLYALEHIYAANNKTCGIHLKLDTGMGRLGFSSKELYKVVKNRDLWPSLRFEGLYSHLSSADEPLGKFNTVQLDTFALILNKIKNMGWKPSVIHLSNSAGLIHFPSACYNLVRPGLAIYGAYPSPHSKKLVQLRPAMSFKSKIIEVRYMLEGSPVSYGHSFYTTRPSKIAVIPVGYDDGYMRALSNKSMILIRGRRCPVVGRICMKAFMADVSELNGVSPGEEVVLLGSQADEVITAEELAEWGGTISYELFCLLGTRNKRIFKENY
jgi:alanine racemase